MLAELGQFILGLALLISLIQALLPWVGHMGGIPGWQRLAVPTARLQTGLVMVAFAMLTWIMVSNDFSVAYAAHNSNTALPVPYRISAVWGAHEGSMLLWVAILAGWTWCLSHSRRLDAKLRDLTLSILGFVNAGILAFVLFTSSPFSRQFPIPAEGRDLNPMLQDPGLIFHPPLLYMGYVGLAVPFALAVAALLLGRLDGQWARIVRPWALMAWVFLTLGIALGSWWAYYELGWGGWWFWDPVENASFMPWLTATALIHSLASTDNRGLFKAWTVLLAILSFSLSLLGTFLVRSGVLTSVHAFASDPTRGIFILMLLGIVVGASLSIFASHGQRIRSHQGFAMLSREAGLLLNNILLLVITGAILLGTLYPLLIDALGLGKLSVGPPYFNAIFLPLGGMLMGLLGAGSWLHWKQDRPERVLSLLRWPFWASLAGSVALSLCLPDFNPGALLCIWLALWVTLTTLGGLLDKGRHGLGRISRSQWGMVVAHLGLAILAVGIGLTSIYSTEQTVRLAPGESLTLSGYRFTFEGTRTVMGPNYRAIEGRLEVQKAGAPVTAMLPQKRFYHAMPGNPMTEAAIDPGIGRDLFVALGEDLGEQGAWSLRIYHKPFVSWIWASAFFMATGGLLALSDRRYRKTRIQQQQARPATPAQGMEVGA